jgi:hypothetical protein
LENLVGHGLADVAVRADSLDLKQTSVGFEAVARSSGHCREYLSKYGLIADSISMPPLGVRPSRLRRERDLLLSELVVNVWYSS